MACLRSTRSLLPAKMPSTESRSTRLWVLSAAGNHLGTLRGPEHPHNMAWGDDDGRTLYLAAKTGLYRIRLSIPSVRP